MSRIPFRVEAALHLVVICWAVLGVGFSILPSSDNTAAPSVASATESPAEATAAIGVSTETPMGGTSFEGTSATTHVAAEPVSFWSQNSRQTSMFALGFTLMALALAVRHRVISQN